MKSLSNILGSYEGLPSTALFGQATYSFSPPFAFSSISRIIPSTSTESTNASTMRARLSFATIKPREVNIIWSLSTPCMCAISRPICL